MRSRRPSRRCQSSSSAVDSSGSPPGFALHVGDQRVDHVGVDRQARAAGRQLDRAPQLVAAHRPDQHVVGAHESRQLGIDGAAAVEVGADGHQHERAPAYIAGRSDELVDERRALGLVAAEGEDLLELVDRHDQPASGAASAVGALERPHRVLARSQQRERPVLATGQHAAGERGEQPRPQRRGLAAARRTPRSPSAAHPPAAPPSRPPAARGRRTARRPRRRTTPVP